MSDGISIKVENVSKTFKLPHEKTTSIKSAVINFYRRNRTFETQNALQDISFEIKKGEFFGIVGRNGSGKSTLLKILAGIYVPTEGNVYVNGSLTPFIELGVGFNPELTGRENVFLNGALLGFNRKEMHKMYKDIVEFAELERFMDQKLKNYSSGMQVRLAFSIAIRAESDILVLDEVLAVGDLDFQQKCYDFFISLKEKGQTVVLVTHDMSAVSKFCDRALLLNEGTISTISMPKEIADSYIQANYEQSRKKTDLASVKINKELPRITSVEVKPEENGGNTFLPGAKTTVTLSFVNPAKKPIHFGFQIFNTEGVYCFGTNSKIEGVTPTNRKSGKIDVELALDLVPGQYTITAATMSENGLKSYDHRPNAAKFRIQKTVETEGVANLRQNWRNPNV